MDKVMYQIRIKEKDINDYIGGRISGILDWCMYTGEKVKSADVICLDGEWIFNFKVHYETFLKIRDYITRCYPNTKIEYFRIIDNQRVEV